VSPRAPARTAPCTQANARARFRKAQSFATGAELALAVGDDPLLDLPGVAAALAVLAGIAAADAAAARRSESGPAAKHIRKPSPWSGPYDHTENRWPATSND
jgi:hypothetical protein